MILNPSCSEIVFGIVVRNEVEAIEVIKDMVASLGGRLLLNAGGYIYSEKKADDGTILLKLVNSYDREGRHNEDMVRYIEEKAPPFAAVTVDIPIELLCLRNNRIDINERLNDVVFERVELSNLNRIMENVRLDISDMYNMSIKINSIEIRYDIESHEGLSKQGTIFIRENCHERKYFPHFKKLMNDLSGKYRIIMKKDGGGSLLPFDEWCKLNFLDFIMKRDRYTDYDITVKGKMYVSSIEDLKEFIVFLQGLRDIGIRLIWFREYKMNNYSRTELDPADVQDISSNGEISAIINNENVCLADIALIPEKPYISDESDDYQYEFRKCFQIGAYMFEKNRYRYYIYKQEMEWDEKREPEEFKVLTAYLEKNSELILNIDD